MSHVFDQSTESEILSLVKELPLAVYDPAKPRRSRAPVESFEIELLEYDEAEDGTLLAVAAGPVVLSAEEGVWESHLRLIVQIEKVGDLCRIVNPESTRAAYIVVANEDTGSCKETIALATA